MSENMKGLVVTWKAAGKISRLDGVAGTVVSGVVKQVRADGSVQVEKLYDSVVPLASLSPDQILSKQSTAPQYKDADPADFS